MAPELLEPCHVLLAVSFVFRTASSQKYEKRYLSQHRCKLCGVTFLSGFRIGFDGKFGARFELSSFQHVVLKVVLVAQKFTVIKIIELSEEDFACSLVHAYY